MKPSLIVKKSIGLFLILLCVFLSGFNFYSWIDLDQYVFHISLFCLFYMIATRKMSILSFGVICLVSYIVWHFDFIDGTLHHLIYKKTSSLDQTNQQWTKLYLYGIGLCILSIQFTFKSQRNFMRGFILLSTISTLSVTLLIHSQVIQNGLKTLLNQHNSSLQTLSQRSTFDLADNLKICESLSLNCGVAQSTETLVDSLQIEDRIKAQLKSTLQPDLLEPIHVSYTSHDGHWKRLSIITKSMSNAQFFYILSIQHVNDLQILFENIFGKLMFAAHLVWGPLLILLGLFHQTRSEKND